MTKQEINDLIINNENLAYYMANRYKLKVKMYIEFEDLKSICLLGLVKAGNTFDLSHNIKFSTYACKIMINEILMELRKSYIRRCKTIANLEDTYFNNLTYIDLLIDDSISIEELHIKNNELFQLIDYINELPNDLKDIVLMKLEGNTQINIGEKLNISQPQVCRKYKQALNLLRKKFNC